MLRKDHDMCEVGIERYVCKTESQAGGRDLVGADDELGEEFVREAVEISAVKLGVGSGHEVGFYFMLAYARALRKRR
jgi:hypothetical protein